MGDASMSLTPGLDIREATSPDDLAAARALIVEYQASLGVDLEFQHFSDELVHLGTIYGPPDGLLLLARVGGAPLGCIGVRRLDDQACEMKRLYVAPAGRGRGLGRLLAERAMAAARARGYTVMRLDTLPMMQAAQALYESLGFRDVPPYRMNPVPGTRFLEAAL
jgi:putative acetyltransferase